ncbi:hypothetical protein F4604DRAFT_1685282 [Suillus subluteus]|nr:hypothetical protein F4604DRAFT_1688372 [Suillus subluteus]KAG1857041.1 hypothetical protein F4604DRAFT_1685282 [Suillus subluteus]
MHADGTLSRAQARQGEIAVKLVSHSSLSPNGFTTLTRTDRADWVIFRPKEWFEWGKLIIMLLCKKKLEPCSTHKQGRSPAPGAPAHAHASIRADSRNSLKQGVNLEGLQQLCNVSFTKTPVNDELSDPPDHTCDSTVHTSEGMTDKFLMLKTRHKDSVIWNGYNRSGCEQSFFLLIFISLLPLSSILSALRLPNRFGNGRKGVSGYPEQPVSLYHFAEPLTWHHNKKRTAQATQQLDPLATSMRLWVGPSSALANFPLFALPI